MLSRGILSLGSLLMVRSFAPSCRCGRQYFIGSRLDRDAYHAGCFRCLRNPHWRSDHVPTSGPDLLRHRYLASGIGVGLAWIATKAIVEWRDRRARRKPNKNEATPGRAASSPMRRRMDASYEASRPRSAPRSRTVDPSQWSGGHNGRPSSLRTAASLQGPRAESMISLMKEMSLHMLSKTLCRARRYRGLRLATFPTASSTWSARL
jgi:hypothetical protein